MKLVTKERVGARVRRRYDRPHTPLERVRESTGIHAARVAALVTLQQTLDPFALAQRIDHALAAIYQLANHRVRATAVRVDAASAVDAQNAPTSAVQTVQTAVSHSAHTPSRLLLLRVR